MREIVMIIMVSGLSGALILQIVDNLVITFPELGELLRKLCEHIRRYI